MINILIVDDNPDKILAMKEGWECSISFKLGIDISKNVKEAKLFLSQKVYDIAIIDLALPIRDMDSPKDSAGIELIQEIYDFDYFKRPNEIIAITQHDNLNDEYNIDLKNKGVILHKFSPSEDISHYLLERILLAKNVKKQISYNYDICILTALHEEAQPIIDNSDWSWEEFKIDDLLIYHCVHPIKKTKIALVCMYKMGLVTSTIYTMKILNSIKPKMVIMLGICAGIEGEVNIGDIILANPCWEWQTGKWKGKKFNIEPYQTFIDEDIIQSIRSICSEKRMSELWQNCRNMNRPDHIPKLHVGPVASGSSVIANSALMEAIKNQNRKMLGLDMELYGMYAACNASVRKTQFLGIKSVCDFGTEKKGDSYHNYCATLVAKVVLCYTNEKYN